jgi:hypothetical protein
MRAILVLFATLTGCAAGGDTAPLALACDAPTTAEPVCDCAFTLSWDALGAEVTSVGVAVLDPANPAWDGEALCTDAVSQDDVVSGMSWTANGATTLTFGGGLDAMCQALPSALPSGSPALITLTGPDYAPLLELVLLPAPGGPSTIEVR